MRSIAFELYSKGLTTRDVGSVMEQIYGKKYSAQAISHISNEFKEELKEWRNRPLQKYYKAVYIDALYTKVRRDDVSKEDFQKVFNLNLTDDDKKAIMNRLESFSRKWGKIYPEIEKLPKKERIEHYFTYLGYSYHIRRMIYTTNWIERLNRSFKKVLRVRGSLPDVESALTLISAKAREMEDSTYAYPIKAFAEEAKFEFYPEE